MYHSDTQVFKRNLKLLWSDGQIVQWLGGEIRYQNRPIAPAAITDVDERLNLPPAWY